MSRSCSPGDLRRTAGARQAEGLVVDLRGRNQDHQEADPNHQENPSISAWVPLTFTIAQRGYQARTGTVAPGSPSTRLDRDPDPAVKITMPESGTCCSSCYTAPDLHIRRGAESEQHKAYGLMIDRYR
jgi:hypothetical protein